MNRTDQPFITQWTLDFWKKRARRVTSERRCRRYEALEIVARDLGFSSWKEIRSHHDRIRPVEKRTFEGCAIVMDSKEADSSHFERIGYHVSWEEVPAVIMPYILGCYGRLARAHWDDVLLGDYRREETWDFRDYVGDLRFYFSGNDPSATCQELLDRVDEHTFFAPRYVWFRGRFHDLSEYDHLRMGERKIIQASGNMG